MSAATLGNDLLREVKEESLNVVSLLSVPMSPSIQLPFYTYSLPF